MPAWKNITLDIPKGDLNSISEKISEIKRVLSITITDKIDEPNSKWFDENGKQQPLLGETHLMKLLTSASINSELLNNDIRKKLEDETINILKEEIFEDRDWIPIAQLVVVVIHFSSLIRITLAHSKLRPMPKHNQVRIFFKSCYCMVKIRLE